jgi:oligosaccharide repeat unit polymerase
MASQLNPAAAPSRGPLIVVVGHLAVIALLVTFAGNYDLFGLRSDELIWWLSVTVTMVTIWGLVSWRALTGSMFNPYIIFFLAACLFNGAQAYLEVFHLNELGILFRFTHTTIIHTLFVVAIGLASMHLGAMLAYCFTGGRPVAFQQVGLAESDAIRIVGFGLFAISFAPAMYLFYGTLRTALTAGYAALYAEGGDTGVSALPQLMSNLLIAAAILILIANPKSRFHLLASGGIIALYLFANLAKGSRSYAVMPLIGFAWVFHRVARPLPGPLIIGAGSLLMFIVFPLVRQVREAGGEKLSGAFLTEAFTSIDNPAIAILAEMGISMTTIAYTIDLVPAYRPHDTGVSYYYALLTILPNVFGGRVHPAVAHGSLSDWLIWTVDPSQAKIGLGFGYSFIAEAYMNFGDIGGPVALAGLGAMLVLVWQWAERSGKLLRFAVIGCMLCYLPRYSRGESVSISRELIWYGFLPYLMVVVMALLLKSIWPARFTPGYRPRPAAIPASPQPQP